MTQLTVHYFDGVQLPLLRDFGDASANAISSLPIPASDLDPARAAALARFLALRPEQRLADSRHVHAYYLDVRQHHGMEFLDQEMGIPSSPAAIWEHVRPGPIHVARDEDGVHYVGMEAECAWEVEHGLLLVWREGEVLSRVSSDDGGLTNAWVLNDPSLGDVVYAAADGRFTTRL